MMRANSVVVLTATDIVNHLGCEHLTALDLADLDDPQATEPTDPTLALLQRKGDAWERTFLEQLRAKHGAVEEIARDVGRDAAAAATERAMAAGVPIVYQGVLLRPGYYGRSDFLRRIPGRSRYGDWQYEVLDTKLSRQAKAGHVLQLCFYSWLVAELQGTESPYMHVVLGDGVEQSFRVADYSRYFHRLRARAELAVRAPRTDTYPDPCEKCGQCRWQKRCDQRRVEDDHLWQVAGIGRSQIQKLTSAGIDTMTKLAATEPTRTVPRLAAESFRRARTQAVMQVKGRGEPKPRYELKPREPERGFLRLPPPSEGDLYFDMEGDPISDGGLEYLFGVTYRENGERAFRAFWGHTRADEKRAFEAFIDFVGERLARWQDLHIYHYAAYERTALEKLMSMHGTRELEVDALFKERRLVDLYRVVAESIVASTDSYSIKAIERFYRDARTGEVKDAGASIVQYEKWRESGDDAILADIERYNRDDCESTAQLHDWLQSIRPDDCTWRSVGEKFEVKSEDGEKIGEREESPELAEARRLREAAKAALAKSLPDDPLAWTDDHRVRDLARSLIDFHRRCDKPTWWKIFSCADLTVEELRDDIECIGGMRRMQVIAPTGRGRLPKWVYEYPEQEFKLVPPRGATRADTHAGVTVEKIDEATRRMVVKPSGKALEPDPIELSLGPGSPVATRILREGVLRFAQSLVDESGEFPALGELLRKAAPRLHGRASGVPIVPRLPTTVADVSTAVAALDRSYLFIQGPPGAGKTYTGSRVIVDLLQAGKRVGVTSNSHKAIHNLLHAVVDTCKERGFRPEAAKKASRGRDETEFDGDIVHNYLEAAEALTEDIKLVAGTAWLFAEPAAQQKFDYLFVDEAGQVSLGHLVAMGLAAKNIVLLGDQMQLPQPVQGVHPGRSGDSVLDYLLDGQAVIPPDRGIFLANTWRMHPDVCRFISDAVYDGQLVSAADRDRQAVLFDACPPDLAPTGIRFIPVEHDGCGQKSEEEAVVVRRLFDTLLGVPWRNHEGEVAPLGIEDILVVAPYNLQVNLLKNRLPDGARVGTVDKFQGQEAPVVLVSLATSSGDYLPRNLEFLYSKNRLNVALSRAKCLAVLVASPKLLDVQCRTAEQIRLVNTLCWVEEYSRGARRGERCTGLGLPQRAT